MEYIIKCKIAQEKWYECSVEADSVEEAVDKVCRQDFEDGSEWEKESIVFVNQYYIMDEDSSELEELSDELSEKLSENIELERETL